MSLIVKIILSTIAVFVTAYILPGIELSGMVTALVVAVVMGILNVLLRPILILLSLPVTILTLGLFLFVINACIVYLTAELIDGFNVRNFWWALAFSLILSIINSIFDSFISGQREPS